jgi:dihydroneopterin aldolase
METEEYKKHGWGSNVKDYKEYAERTQKEDAQREVETLEAITNKITEKVTKAHKKYLTDEINKPVDNG